MGRGGAGIWYKHGPHSLPGTVPLGRGAGPNDRVKRELAGGPGFQVLKSSLAVAALVIFRPG